MPARRQRSVSAGVAVAAALAVAACRVGDFGGGLDAAGDATGDDAGSDVDAPASIVDAPSPDAAPIDAAVHACPAPGPPQCTPPGSGTGEADQCHDGPSCFLARVQSAVNGTVAAHPAWFRWDDTIPCWIVLDVDQYLDAVVADLVAHQLCAIRDPNAPGEEITVKHDDLFSENFDILASTGCARSGAHIYTGYCAPAWW